MNEELHLKSILSALDILVSMNEKEFNAAKEGQLWSQLPGIHGIGTGIRITRKLILDEIKLISSRGNVK